MFSDTAVLHCLRFETAVRGSKPPSDGTQKHQQQVPDLRRKAARTERRWWRDVTNGGVKLHLDNNNTHTRSRSLRELAPPA